MSLRIVSWGIVALAVHLTALSPALASPLSRPADFDFDEVQLAQRARTCKDVRTCEEAVRLWCGGYSRADGDKDGIPCENVCRSKEEVDRIRQRIGC